MRVWQHLYGLAAVVLLALLPVDSALAVSISGRSSTEIEWFDTADGETAVPGYEYLLVNVRDIDEAGLDFRGYGRLADDINNEEKIDSRLYYAYFEKKGVVDGLDLRLGRQFVATAAGASLMDGLHLVYEGLGPFGVTLFGGGDVTYYEGYNAKDIIDGIEVSASLIDDLELDISYVQKWDESELTHELAGFAADYDYKRLLNVYAEMQYDMLSEAVSYGLAGARYHRAHNWSLQAEYLYSLPIFSSTSIYSVFSVSKYEELSTQLDLHIARGVRGFLRYVLEMYEEYNNARVYELGFEKIRTDRFAGYVSAVYRDDDGGEELRGVKMHGSWKLNDMFRAGAGMHLDVLERRIEEDDETTSRRLWLDLVASINKTTSVEAKVERTDSELWDEYYRGRVRLNILF
ncbi:MAG: hypothetical protein C0621_10255 [Desulfuromonas sp.]|nr:MAG: hypothetical protein C0621_10255 [Desulfuromonas sp.]